MIKMTIDNIDDNDEIIACSDDYVLWLKDKKTDAQYRPPLWLCKLIHSEREAAVNSYKQQLKGLLGLVDKKDLDEAVQDYHDRVHFSQDYK